MPVNLSQPVSACRLWIDGVGCWVLNFDHPLVLGNPLPLASHAFKLGINGNLRTEHLRLEHVDGHWLADPLGAVHLNERPLASREFLQSSNQLTLGEDVQLRLQTPNSLSPSATLQLESGHRFAEGVNGVVLFQQTCLLGAGRKNHIDCRKWRSELVFFTRGGQLFCKSSADDISVNDQPIGRMAVVTDKAHLQGTDWSIRVEGMVG